MSLTVADIEVMVIRRTRAYLVRCDLDASTSDGSNPDLRDPIREASMAVGVTPAALAVTDDEVADVSMSDLASLIGVAELKTLELCRGNWAEFDQSADGESQSLSQLTKALDDRIAALKAELAPLLLTGYVPGGSASGVIAAGRCYPPRPQSWWYRDAYGRGNYYP